jgi:hypothetical protein
MPLFLSLQVGWTISGGGVPATPLSKVPFWLSRAAIFKEQCRGLITELPKEYCEKKLCLVLVGAFTDRGVQ